jgi:hypothetical protein
MTISTSSRYRRLIDSGIYDDFFPLRANACFHILDKDDNGSFNLRDFVENVKYISSYLSICMDTASDFTIIVSFTITITITITTTTITTTVTVLSLLLLLLQSLLLLLLLLLL